MHSETDWRNILAAVVAKSQGRPRRWLNARNSSVYKNPHAAYSTWQKGGSIPPITKIIAAADILGVTENEVAMALYGVASQAEALDIKKASERSMHKAWYSKRSEGIRESEHKRARGKTLRNREQTLRGPMLTHEWMVTAVWMRREGVVTDCELANLKAITLARHKRSALYKTRRRKEAVVYQRKKRSGRACLRWGVRLERLIKRMADLRLMMDREVKHASKPWIFAGYRSKKEWANSTPEGREWRLTEWQAKTHRRRARQKKAGGEGVTREEWCGIMKDHDYRCAYCGARRYAKREDGTKVKLTIDHVLPMPEGRDEAANVLPACDRCNTSKGQKDLLEWSTHAGLELSSDVVNVYKGLKDAAFMDIQNN